MLALVDGRPAIFCGKCAQKLTLGETLVLTYEDITAVSFVCESCACKLEQQWKDKQTTTMSARRYFEQLCGSSSNRPRSQS